MSHDEFKLWDFPSTDPVGVFISHLRHCNRGATSNELALLNKWYQSKHLMEVYTKKIPQSWDTHFEFRLISNSSVIAKGCIRHAFLHEYAEWWSCFVRDMYPDNTWKQLQMYTGRTHWFCVNCMKQWNNINKVCPVCGDKPIVFASQILSATAGDSAWSSYEPTFKPTLKVSRYNKNRRRNSPRSPFTASAIAA